MVNGDTPSDTVRARMARSKRRLARQSRILPLLPVKKRSTHRQEKPWEMIVASAAPRTPMPSAKMNSGSSAIFSAAPMTTENIASLAKPCAEMKGLSPSTSCTNTVPSR